ncbi:NAD(P)/FAD-dependent oxidoreductase [Rubrimonas cliftonensis]|uniref:Sulfide:quinone oxidoreductase n=1 Tax=Rubrimonas cliftonensis TaxID=89524 RepID=A0A1H3YEN6_9RHOB|nr:FAD-dependent oxidoreductase [Rubrimonas cliftonensis]SEA10069.1 sulfide:quinone oxidoreductase [Rubrimonas cliftonensis]
MTEADAAPAARRRFLGLAAAALAAAAAAPLEAQPVGTSARILILGAGAAGITAANQLARRVEGAAITLVDPRREHLYQPGLSLVATGLKPEGYVLSRTREWLPAGVTLVEEAVAAIDPEARRVTTDAGRALGYDFLIVALGLALDDDAIEGFSRDMIGTNGLGALYGGPQDAARTWAAVSAYAEKGGLAVFTRPATEMKCAGAPLKHCFLVDDIASRGAAGARREILYAANNKALFSVPIVSEKVRMLFETRRIGAVHDHVLKAIEPGRRIATFATPEGDVEIGYDYLHVIPPQRAPRPVRESGLSWADRWTDQGWVEVDPHSLRHRRYPEVFAVGDVAGVPKGKTAASVKWQVPVMVDHLVAALQGREGTARYDGYTSCPLITRVGRAMLVEFDYANNLAPSFPGVIAPLEELWISWLIKELALKPTYLAMLRGDA